MSDERRTGRRPGGSDPGRDPVVAEAIARIPVPQYDPGFWDRLEERLAEPGDATVVPLARRRAGGGGRRGPFLAVAAVAAAAVLAVVAVQLSGDGGETVQTAEPGTSTTLADSSLAAHPVRSALGEPGSTTTPQDAFITWVTALQEGDDAAARALVGPRTVAYYEAMGADVDEVMAAGGWERWAGTEALIDVLDFGEVDGLPVAGLLISGAPDPTVEGAPDEGVDGPSTDGIVLVRHGTGWLVEPAAHDIDAESRLEFLTPSEGEQGLEPLAPGGPVRLQVRGDGVYYVGVADGALRGFPGSGAEDGVVTWYPEEPLEPGRHRLLVAHVSPEVLSFDVFRVTVADDPTP